MGLHRACGRVFFFFSGKVENMKRRIKLKPIKKRETKLIFYCIRMDILYEFYLLQE